MASTAQIDASIPLRVNVPKLMGPSEAISLQQAARQAEMGQIEIQEARRKQAEGAQLRQVLSQPGATTQDGMVSPTALSEITRINPQTAMQIQQQQNQRVAQATQQRLSALNVTSKQNDLIEEALTGVYADYQRVKASGGPEAAAAHFRTTWAQRIDDMEKSGQFTPDQIQGMRRVQSPDMVEGVIGGSKAYREWVNTQAKTDTAPKKQERIQGDTLIQEQWDPQTRTWKEIGRGPRFAKQVAPVVKVGGDGGSGGGKPPAGYRWNSDRTALEAIPGGPADKGTGQALTQDAIDLRASQYLAGDSRATANLGRGRQGAEDIIKITNRAAEMLREKGGNPQEIGRRIAEFRSNSASLTALTKQYDAVTAFEETAVRNGEVLNDLAKKVDKTGIPVIERWLRAGRKEIAGDTEVAQFMAQLSLYRAEAAKILTNPSMGGVLSDSARKEIEEFLKPGASAGQIIGVTNLLKRDFKNRKETMEQQINSVRGRLEKNLGPGEGTPKPSPGFSGSWKIEKVP